MFFGDRFDGGDKPFLVIDALIEKLLPARCKTAHEKVVATFGRLVDDVSQRLGNLCEHGLRFIEVANDDFPALSPSRLKSLSKSIEQLRESFHFRSRVNRRFGQLQDFLSLRLRITLCKKIRFGVCAGKLRQRLSKNIRGKPFTTSKRFSERSVLLNERIDIRTHVLSSSFQCRLEHFAAHASVHNRVPVHKTDSTRSKSL